MNKFYKALERIMDSYDAFYFENKYGDGTHKEEFDTLSQLEGEYVGNALLWIRHNYDCHYKYQFEDPEENTPFNYLYMVIGAVDR